MKVISWKNEYENKIEILFLSVAVTDFLGHVHIFLYTTCGRFDFPSFVTWKFISPCLPNKQVNTPPHPPDQSLHNVVRCVC